MIKNIEEIAQRVVAFAQVLRGNDVELREADAIGRRLVGRLPGWHLSDDGRAQAERLVETLRAQPIARIYSSPLERTVETAQRHGLGTRAVIVSPITGPEGNREFLLGATKS